MKLVEPIDAHKRWTRSQERNRPTHYQRRASLRTRRVARFDYEFFEQAGMFAC